MALDPTVAAAIVTAAGGLLQKELELSATSSPEAMAEKVMSKVYEQVASAVSSNSLRVLIVLQEVGSFLLPEQIAEQVQRLASHQEPCGKPLEADLTYRLRYLCLLGLVGGRIDFALTRLGAAFIEQARRDKLRYSKVFTTFGV